MIKKIDITNPDIARDVLKIQTPSYMVEAALIGCEEIPPLKDTVETLQQCEEIFYGFYRNGELSGVLSLKLDQNVMDLHRLFVDPKHFKKGIAEKLLEYVQRNEVPVAKNLSLTYFEKTVL